MFLLNHMKNISVSSLLLVGSPQHPFNQMVCPWCVLLYWGNFYCQNTVVTFSKTWKIFPIAYLALCPHDFLTKFYNTETHKNRFMKTLQYAFDLVPSWTSWKVEATNTNNMICISMCLCFLVLNINVNIPPKHQTYIFVAYRRLLYPVSGKIFSNWRLSQSCNFWKSRFSVDQSPLHVCIASSILE